MPGRSMIIAITRRSTKEIVTILCLITSSGHNRGRDHGHLAWVYDFEGLLGQLHW